MLRFGGEITTSNETSPTYYHPRHFGRRSLHSLRLQAGTGKKLIAVLDAQAGVQYDGEEPPKAAADDRLAIEAWNYLCANGAGQGGKKLEKAIWFYNHSWSYVAKVMSISQAYAATYP